MMFTKMKSRRDFLRLGGSLVSAAGFSRFGLMNALEAFDTSRGLAFSTFAVPRIRGAILDELRRQDHVPRSVRKKTRDLSGARETLTRIFGRQPTDIEMAEHLGIDIATLWRWQSETESAVQISLDHSASDQDTHTLHPMEPMANDGREPRHEWTRRIVGRPDGMDREQHL